MASKMENFYTLVDKITITPYEKFNDEFETFLCSDSTLNTIAENKELGKYNLTFKSTIGVNNAMFCEHVKKYFNEISKCHGYEFICTRIYYEDADDLSTGFTLEFYIKKET